MGGVGCHVLLDGDLGHVLDGVVDIVADVLDDSGGGDCVGGDSGGLDNRGSSDNWGVVDNRDNSLANGVDEAPIGQAVVPVVHH